MLFCKAFVKNLSNNNALEFSFAKARNFGV